MRKSVLEAIKDGNWDYEPSSVPDGEFPATRALPGSDEKLTVLADRLRRGEPLWHPSDRMTYNDQDPE